MGKGFYNVFPGAKNSLPPRLLLGNLGDSALALPAVGELSLEKKLRLLGKLGLCTAVRIVVIVFLLVPHLEPPWGRHYLHSPTVHSNHDSS